jgi:acyl-CoA thioesterase I
MTGEIVAIQRERSVAKLNLRGGLCLRANEQEQGEIAMLITSVRLATATAVFVAWIATPASAQSVDQSYYYKPSTELRGAGMRLDAFNGGRKNNLTPLEPDHDVAGQYWRPAPVTGVGTPSAACAIAPEQVRFDFPLPHTSRALASGGPLKIVALGSSSTYGAGASSSAAAYPNRLAEELAKQFPGHGITVLNRGVNGEEITDMLARLDEAVIAERPDLVLWQFGTNSVLQDRALQPHVGELQEGLQRLKAIGADVVLIDPQYAPRFIAKANSSAMVSLISTAAKAEHIGVFHRFDLMRHWYVAEHLPFTTFVSADGLHMNDWSYGCFAKALGMAIAEAAMRPVATAVGPRVAPHLSRVN